MSEKKGGKRGNKEKDTPEFQQAAMMKTLSEIISTSVDKVSRGEALNLVRALALGGSFFLVLPRLSLPIGKRVCCFDFTGWIFVIG